MYYLNMTGMRKLITNRLISYIQLVIRSSCRELSPGIFGLRRNQEDNWDQNK